MRLGALLIAGCLLVSSQSSLQATTWHVNPDGSGDATTISDGLGLADWGDTVLVACGTYYETGLALPFGVSLIGTSEEPHCVVVDGQDQDRILSIDAADETTLLENLTFRAGFAFNGGAVRASGTPRIERCRFENNRSSDDGGAVSGSSVQLIACEFVGNQSDRYGGAVAVRVGEPLVEECVFRNNSSTMSGGALAIDGGTVRDCLFEGNQSLRNGGGLSVDYHGTVSVRDCAFRENHASLSGGGASTNTCFDAAFVRCHFQSNTAGLNGGGLYVYNADIPTGFCTFVQNVAGHAGGGYAGDSAAGLSNHASTLHNCTFWGNSATSGGGVAGVRNGFPGFERCIIAGSAAGGAFHWETATPAPYLACCDLWGNTGGDWIGVIEGLLGSDGNFSADPLFCDRDAGDFTIQSDSPCAPPGVTNCGLVGALPFGCGPVSLTPETWGRIKARFRTASEGES